jgi:Family of unknown function (DUF6352)
MSGGAAVGGDPWVASGHHLCERDAAGRLVPTPDLWRAFLARPELLPPEEACAAELALHTTLLADPLRPVSGTDLAGLADPDARENWTHFLRFRDRVAAAPTLEAAFLSLFRGSVSGVPPLFLQMLTQLVVRAAMEGVDDAFALRAAEILFRPQRAAIRQGALLLADEEWLESLSGGGADHGTLGRLLAEAGAPPREVEVEVLSEANAAGYARRSDTHDLALDIAEGRPGQHGLARALERFVAHVLGEGVAIRPAAVIEDRDWRWHVGLDTEATAITNDLWKGEAVEQARLARILWLAKLDFADGSRVLPRARGKPVYLALAMDAAQRVRCKPQNLVAGLPLLPKEAGA